MFRFFKTRKWALWAWLGSFVILSSLWVQVQIDVMINSWFGEFYDMIQKALGTPNAITMQEYWGSCFLYYPAGIYVMVAVLVVILPHIFCFGGGHQWLNGIIAFMMSPKD